MRVEEGLHLLAQGGIFTIIFASYYLIAHRLHLVSFGYASVMALGMFIALHLLRAGWPTWAFAYLPLATGLLCAVITLPLTFLLARFSGTLFAMMSLALAEIVFLTAASFPSLWGDDLGFSINRNVLAPAWANRENMLGLVSIYVFLSALLLYLVCRQKNGLRHLAARDNPLLAAHLGIVVTRLRAQALIISALLAGVAGTLLLLLFEFVSASVWDPVRSVQMVVFSFISGGAWWGPLLSSGVWVLAQTLLPRYTQTGYLYVGIVFIAVVYWRTRRRSVVVLGH